MGLGFRVQDAGLRVQGFGVRGPFKIRMMKSITLHPHGPNKSASVGTNLSRSRSKFAGFNQYLQESRMETLIYELGSMQFPTQNDLY